MGSWINQNRETILFVVAASAVFFPLLIGVCIGQLPRETLIKWALPLAAGTILLTMGIRYLDRIGEPRMRLAVNIIFGLLWIVGGCSLLLRKLTSSEGIAAPTERTARLFGLIFVVFGLLWETISIIQFLRPG